MMDVEINLRIVIEHVGLTLKFQENFKQFIAFARSAC